MQSLLRQKVWLSLVLILTFFVADASLCEEGEVSWYILKKANGINIDCVRANKEVCLTFSVDKNVFKNDDNIHWQVLITWKNPSQEDDSFTVILWDSLSESLNANGSVRLVIPFDSAQNYTLSIKKYTVEKIKDVADAYNAVVTEKTGEKLDKLLREVYEKGVRKEIPKPTKE